MSQAEVVALEERLRRAELGPDPSVFQELLADDAVLVSEKGLPSLAKSQVVAAHQPGTGPKFTRVEIREMQVVDHGNAAVVTCQGTYETSNGSMTLKFMRVWLKKDGRWQIIAGSISTG